MLEQLSQRWSVLDGKKTALKYRCEKYAGWTLPYIFPPENAVDQELQSNISYVGPAAVNHLSNKLVLTLFPPYTPFFKAVVSSDIASALAKKAKDGDAEAQAILQELDAELADAERASIQALDYNRYRTEATNVAKSLIITGNALLYHPEGKTGKVQYYNLRNYCVVRDLSGTVIEIMTRDMKAFSTFNDTVKEALRTTPNKKYDDESNVTIYSQIKLQPNGKFALRQAADDIELESKGEWPIEDLPWIPLTWNLIKGEDYGRGLVEDYAGAFHAVSVLTNALIDVVAVAGDIKWLVRPASNLDVQELNNSDSGTYHVGEEGDIVAVQLNKTADLQLVQAAIDKFERAIGAAFLLASAVTRDAERVTAEEIRNTVNQLETSHGGIYSRFAEEWQLPTARLIMRRVRPDVGKSKNIIPQVITGLDGLSRAGELDNLRLYISDLTLLDAVPEELRAVFDPFKFASFVGIRRGVEFSKFLKSAQQVAQEQQAQLEQQQQMMQNQIGTQAAADAMVNASKQGQTQ